jgi:hypothetical protein
VRLLALRRSRFHPSLRRTRYGLCQFPKISMADQLKASEILLPFSNEAMRSRSNSNLSSLTWKAAQCEANETAFDILRLVARCDNPRLESQMKRLHGSKPLERHKPFYMHRSSHRMYMPIIRPFISSTLSLVSCMGA